MLLVLLVLLFESIYGFNTKRPGPFQGLKVSCKVLQEETFITSPGCTSQKYKVNYCSGNCPSTTTYHNQYPWFKTKCFCCKARKMKESYFPLQCVNKAGRNVTRHISQDDVVECKCGHCSPP